MSPGARIILSEEDDWWVANDEETGVTSQGRTREAAQENLDEAVALRHWQIGREPTCEELWELVIDPPRYVSGKLDDSAMFE